MLAPMAGELLTTGQVAHHLGVNVSVARRWMATGHPPAVLVDGGWRVRADELEAWVESRRVKPTRGSRTRDRGAVLRRR